MQALVVGAGAVGQWFAETLVAESDEPVAVTFTDTDETAAATAAEAVPGADSTVTGTEERFDLVCVAVPIPAAGTAIERYAANATDAMMDVTGSAGAPVASMRDSFPGGERVSVHPLFAPENAPGNVAVVPDESGPVTDAVRDCLSAAGNQLFETTAEAHDEAMETVQAKAHAAVLAFGLAADEVPAEFQTPVSAALDEIVSQVGAGDPRVYADIKETFDGADDVATAADRIAAADREEFRDLYREVADRS